MITSSSKRIIKASDSQGDFQIENYLPSLEQLMDQNIVPREPVFPQYTLEGKKKDTGKQPGKKAPLSEKTPKEEEELFEDIAAAREEALQRKEEKLLEEWKEEGARLLDEARKEAVRILEESKAQAEEEKARAYEEGRQEGYEAGFTEGRERGLAEFRQEVQSQLVDFQADMKQALKSVDKARERCLHTYLDELKDCAIAVGEKVIHISLKSSGEVIKHMIISATEKLKKTAWVKIYIDKYDYDMMMEADAGVVDELSRLSDNIKFIVMDKEDRGSCIVEMPEEIVDVSVSTQMGNIRDMLETIRL